MKEFNADDALKGAPVKLRNGLKAYIKKYSEDNVFAYSGHAAGERDEYRSWTRKGTEYFNCESPYDIVSMWEDEEQETNLEADREENIFEKAMNVNLPIRHTTQRDDVPDFYCIAKTRDDDYILEREDRGTKLIARLSSLAEDLDWYIVEQEIPVGSIPKAFRPKEGETFWIINTASLISIESATFDTKSSYHAHVVNSGIAFRTREDALQILNFLKNNIE